MKRLLLFMALMALGFFVNAQTDTTQIINSESTSVEIPKEKRNVLQRLIKPQRYRLIQVETVDYYDLSKDTTESDVEYRTVTTIQKAKLKRTTTLYYGFNATLSPYGADFGYMAGFHLKDILQVGGFYNQHVNGKYDFKGVEARYFLIHDGDYPDVTLGFRGGLVDDQFFSYHFTLGGVYRVNDKSEFHIGTGIFNSWPSAYASIIARF